MRRLRSVLMCVVAHRAREIGMPSLTKGKALGKGARGQGGRGRGEVIRRHAAARAAAHSELGAFLSLPSRAPRTFRKRENEKRGQRACGGACGVGGGGGMGGRREKKGESKQRQGDRQGDGLHGASATSRGGRDNTHASCLGGPRCCSCIMFSCACVCGASPRPSPL